MFHVLVIEDDKNTSKLMKAVLTRAGYEVTASANGEEGLDVLDKQHTDLILLDVMMPVMDGYAFTEILRDGGDNTPILMVTSKQLPEEKCKGFRVGVDDYMVKPVNEEEMLLRIKALLRRANIANDHRLRIGSIILDYDAFSVTKGNDTQTIPQKEFQLLYLLLSYPDKIFTRLQLMDEIWGKDSDSLDTTINVHVNRLRKRFEDWQEFEIVAVRGIGYKAVIRHVA